MSVAALVASAAAQPADEQPGPLPAQAKPVQGVAMPVAKEVFRSLDEFPNANWRAVQHREIARWKSHGDQVQIAALLGVVLAEGFIAMEAEDAAAVKDIGNTVLRLARGLGVEEQALQRSRSIMEHADRGEWVAARNEWDGVLSDLEGGLIHLKSGYLSEIVSAGGWLRGSEALSGLVLQNYSPDRANLVRQPVLIDQLEKQLLGMPAKTQNRPLVVAMLKGIRRIRELVEQNNQPLSEQNVREIHDVCRNLVHLSSRRSAASP